MDRFVVYEQFTEQQLHHWELVDVYLQYYLTE